MARAAPATKNTKPMVAKPKPGRPAAAAKAPAKPAKAAAAAKPVAAAKASAAQPIATKRQAAVPTPAATPKPSKDELRAQVEKLEGANETLRTKSRETNKAMKAAAKRIAELEEQVAQLERAATAKHAATRPGPKPKAAAAASGKRRSRGIDPGAAVPPRVAVGDPAPRGEEAEAASESPEQNLSGE